MQYEIKDLNDKITTIRAKSETDALSRFGLSDFHLQDTADFAGWIEVWIDNTLTAYIRPFSRMKFRRD